ncbi:penicillin-binding protein 2 [Microbacterium azadirachtae]|uniref:Penicillin-binding protein PbpB n=1 Tax=Microbacterium azadirachtae TaxID=582680 RepID=A0A0F0KAS2_9MICO|nr:penicillin-binding protein 2 [Microbacterium azadirachtae]KJL17494.1 Penicillin-binding protein PbpB [Microbacterium azadirachtae]UXW87216.1 penicillin-binding protein 2 [Microbacterium azadirachtae]
MKPRASRTSRRRTVLALAVILAVMCGFLVRLVDVQVLSASANVKQSVDWSLGSTREIDGARGKIVDSNGTVLAESQLVYDIDMDPSIMRGLETGKTKPKLPWAQASEKIAAILGEKGDAVRTIVADRLKEDPEAKWVELKKGVSADQFLKLRALGLPYLQPNPRSVRVYPNGAVAGNLIGFIAGNGDREGLEEAQNQCLSATKGKESYLTGKDGVVIPGSQTEKPAVDGGTVTLTINTELQWYLQQMISEEVAAQGAKAGTVTVVEVGTGKIRAAAEYPTVDPNDPGAANPEDRGSRIFSTSFEPGSTFKAITAASVMEYANANASTVVTGASSHEEFPNGAVINDAFEHPAYDYTLAGALIDSSNVALSKFGDMVTDQQRYDELVKFGVGSKTAIDFPGEASGVIHPVKDWDYQSHYTTTFGQYYTVTAPQVASAYQAIANGGVKIPLSLVESCTAADGKVSAAPAPKPQRIFDATKDAELSRMIENVAAQGSVSDMIKVPGYRIAAKTGTAQKPDPTTGAYKEGIYFTSMVGYAPADHPEYVVVVTLDEPTRVTSSAATAPAFQKAMTQVLKTYRVQPSTTPMEPLLPKYQ